MFHYVIFVYLLFISTDTVTDSNTILTESEETEQISTREASTNSVKTEDKNVNTTSTAVSGKYSTILIYLLHCPIVSQHG